MLIYITVMVSTEFWMYRSADKVVLSLPYTRFLPTVIRGRRISLGSSIINDISWSSLIDSCLRPSFLTLGLFQENSFDGGSFPIRLTSSFFKKRFSKKSLSSKCTWFCKSHALTSLQVLQRLYQYKRTVDILSSPWSNIQKSSMFCLSDVWI